MNIIESIKLYLGYTPDFTLDVVVFKNNTSEYIKEWNISDKIEPTIEQLQQIYNDNEDLILQNIIEKPHFYYSWDITSKNWVFNLDLYKNHIITNDLEQAFICKLNNDVELSCGFKVKSTWKELYSAIQSGLESCSKVKLGDVIDINITDKKITVNRIIHDTTLADTDLLRIKNSTYNDGFYQIINKEIIDNTTIFTIYNDINSDVVDGNVYNDYCYIKSSDNLNFKLVYTENMVNINSELFSICNKIYQTKHFYQLNLKNQSTKEGVDSVLIEYINI